MEISKRVKSVKPSVTLAVTAKAKAMKAKGISVINFGAGEPDFDTPGFIKDAATLAIDKGKTKYTPSSGTMELKTAICAELNRNSKLKYQPKQIIVSNGAKHSLYNIFQVICEEADEIIIPSPYWVSYLEMVKLAGAKPVIAKSRQEDGFKPTIKALKAAITKNTKALVLNSPCNPTGVVYDKALLKAIADIAVEKNIIVISDEIYKMLIYDGEDYCSIASFGDDIKKLTIVVDGVSKSYSMTGWRIGYLASENSTVIDAIENLQSHSTSNPCSISQEAALCALQSDDSSVRAMRSEFEKRRDYMAGALNKIKDLYCVKPEGAFYCFCDISKTKMDSLEFADKLLDFEKVAVIPGGDFGWPNHIRLSFATSMSDIEEGMKRIEKFVSKLKIKN
ncbi:MAG: pyridoxal phosphate-dependent aminotransferase [Candidatus Omnitrophota bacterium]